MARCANPVCRREVGCSCNLIPKYDKKYGICKECHELKQEALKFKKDAHISPNQGSPAGGQNTQGG